MGKNKISKKDKEKEGLSNSNVKSYKEKYDNKNTYTEEFNNTHNKFS